MATPSWLNGTEAWMTMVKTASVGPIPRPVMNIQTHSVGISVVAVRPVNRKRPRAITRQGPGHQPLEAAGCG